MKTVPNQKVVTVNKEFCDKNHKYAAINLNAMDKAAQELDAGAFKLWCYFAKNQNNYIFALSSKDTEKNFGIKIKQYNNAIETLIEKGYLTAASGNTYNFNEIAVMPLEDNENDVMTKSNNDVMTKSNNDVMTKSNNALLPKDIRNNTNNTLNNTLDNTGELSPPLAAQSLPKVEELVKVSKAQMLALWKPENITYLEDNIILVGNKKFAVEG